MDERAWIARVAEHFRSRGFDVIVEPKAGALPVFLANVEVDLLARKGEQYIGIEVKGNTAHATGIELSQVTADLDLDYAKALLEEADKLLLYQTKAAPLLVTWAAIEAVMRLVGLSRGIATAALPIRDLVRLLHENGILTEQDLVDLDVCRIPRNIVSHGFRAPRDYAQALANLTRLARRLLNIVAPTHESGSATKFFRVRYGESLGKTDQSVYRPYVENATRILEELLESSAGSVAVDWDVTLVDNPSRTAVVLRLSDPFGSVITTFDRQEMRDESTLRQRLHGLWGDLLQIRNHQQLQELEAVSDREGG
jgi:hypothetical protein